MAQKSIVISKPKLILILIILLAIFLRCYSLSEKSLWKDEVLSYIPAIEPTFLSTVQATSDILVNHPPLYSLILHYWLKFFPVNELFIRLPSVIFSLLTIVIIYLICKEYFDKKTSLISSFLLSILFFDVMYAQEARSYTLWLFLSVLSTLFFIKILKTNKNKYYILYVLSSAALIYTHYFATAVIIANNIVIFFITKRKIYLKKWLISLLFILLISLPLVPFVMKGFIETQTATQDEFREMLHLPNILANLGQYLYLAPVVFVILFFILLYIFTTNKNNFNLEYYLSKIDFKKSKTSEFVFIIVSLIIILSMGLIGNKYMYPYFITKYTLFMWPYLILIFSIGLKDLSNKKVRLSLLFLFILVNVLLLFKYYHTETKAPWKDVTDIIRQNLNKEDIILYSGTDNAIAFYYYYTNGGMDYSSIGVPVIDYITCRKFELDKIWAPSIINKTKTKELLNDFKSKKGMWVIYYYIRYNREFVRDILIERFPDGPKLKRTYKNLEIDYYELRK